MQQDATLRMIHVCCLLSNIRLGRVDARTLFAFIVSFHHVTWQQRVISSVRDSIVASAAFVVTSVFFVGGDRAVVGWEDDELGLGGHW